MVMLRDSERVIESLNSNLSSMNSTFGFEVDMKLV